MKFPTKHLLLTGLLFVIVWVVGYSVLPMVQEPGELAAIDNKLAVLTDQDYYDYFVSSIDVIYKTEGVDGQVSRVTEALAEGRIGMYQCHTLAHDIGHYAGYRNNIPDLETNIKSENLNFCGSGFIHGVEGELANLPYPEYIEALHNFCELISDKERYYEGCYHGAGHGFMEYGQSVDEALARCESLRRDDGVSISHCFRGVFSERNASLRNLEPSELLLYCATQPEHLQSDCALEMNGFNAVVDTTTEELNHYIEVCVTTPGVPASVQHDCLKSVTWAATDIELGRDLTLVPLPYVHELSADMQKVYIENAYSVFIKTADYNSSVEWSDFCTDFIPDLKSYCVNLIYRT